MNQNFKVISSLGFLTLMATGCMSLVPPENQDQSGDSGNCLASVQDDAPGMQLPLNSYVSVGAGSGISSQVAEAFVIQGQSRSMSKVRLKLDISTPPGTFLNGTIHLAIYPDGLSSTNGAAQATAPTSNPYVDPATGVAASSTDVDASNISTQGPRWYDFCFDGASGDGCSGNRGGVTFQPGKVYWIVISGAPAGGPKSFLEWRGTNVSYPNGAGEINTSAGYLPVNSPATNHNFDFKLGC